ncbi:hypothetical protein HPC38_02290 [Pasteurellaceae bacterium HPA106]|uniref:hypothetical protein n=1 Tax=Spirabiliibacterium pneumoniae TaxID=221400 RepID=UPI001AAD0AFD|nr:hypothetical protein [Spirabiliibacterium pneumoniae]MBE2895708.1 hypothetical protein [Spirabiliibacterium pneumoniae]
MSKCDKVIADALTAEAVLGKDCSGNIVNAGATLATCADLGAVKEDLAGKVDEVKDKAKDVENKVDALDTATDKLFEDVAVEGGKLIFTRKDGSEKSINLDLDQVKDVDVDDDYLIITNDDDSKAKLSLNKLAKKLFENGVAKEADMKAVKEGRAGIKLGVDNSGEDVVQGACITTCKDLNDMYERIKSEIPVDKFLSGVNYDSETKTIKFTVSGGENLEAPIADLAQSAVKPNGGITGDGSSGNPLRLDLSTQAKRNPTENENGEIATTYIGGHDVVLGRPTKWIVVGDNTVIPAYTI